MHYRRVGWQAWHWLLYDGGLNAILTFMDSFILVTRRVNSLEYIVLHKASLAASASIVLRSDTRVSSLSSADLANRALLKLQTSAFNSWLTSYSSEISHMVSANYRVSDYRHEKTTFCWAQRIEGKKCLKGFFFTFYRSCLDIPSIQCH